MTVLILENVPPSLRGEISKWFIELKAGTFVGKVNALVRQLIWDKCLDKCKEGTVIMIWKTNTEQGFDLQYWNVKNYIPVNFEGIWLTKKK